MDKLKQNRFSFAAIVSLFFLWALAHNLNPILIPHLKRACRLSDMQSALVDSAFYIAYFLMALPAGFVIHRFGYQKTIVGGLGLFSLGALLFYPAAEILSYPLFLLGLFVVASGLTFLETAANPYVNVLGNPDTATQRLNFAQSFNGLGATLAAMFGGQFILSGNSNGPATLEGLSEADILQQLKLEASSVQMPYLMIALLVFAVMLLFMRLPLPDIRNKQADTSFSFARLWSVKAFRLALLAQFFYVGAQVGLGSFFIRYTVFTGGLNQQEAAMYLSFALFLFMLGRFIGSWLMNYLSPARLLLIYALVNMLLAILIIMGMGQISVYAYMLAFFFMSIMFPSIFSIGISPLGEDARFGSSLLVMSIVGGAFFPLIMGAISDAYAIRFAFVVPLICFLVVALFSKTAMQTQTN